MRQTWLVVQRSPEVVQIIAQARARDGPGSNAEFVRYFNRHLPVDPAPDLKWVEERIFEITNIQPALEVV